MQFSIMSNFLVNVGCIRFILFIGKLHWDGSYHASVCELDHSRRMEAGYLRIFLKDYRVHYAVKKFHKIPEKAKQNNLETGC